MPWKKLGKGTFNTAFVYKTPQGRLGRVLKVPIEADDLTDNSERALRLWQTINSHLPPAKEKLVFRSQAAALNKLTKNGPVKAWLCPFVKGKQASDKEISYGLINVFNHTGRIVIDAISPNNFTKTEKGEIECIDVGMALQLEQRPVEEQHSSQPRPTSPSSLEAWSYFCPKYQEYFKKNKSSFPWAVATIQALLFIKENQPDCVDVSFLIDNEDKIKNFARAYEIQQLHSTSIATRSICFLNDILTELEQLVAVDEANVESNQSSWWNWGLSFFSLGNFFNTTEPMQLEQPRF